jgi:endo-alpha-1,4-polygalactosaminidase (GH114 family)
MLGNRTPSSAFQVVGSNADQEKYGAGTRSSWWQRWSLRRKIIVGALILLVLVAVAVGLGVGLTLGGGGGGSDNGGSGGNGNPPGPPISPNGTIPAGIWKPVAGTTWNYELLNTVNDTSADAEVWDIDLVNNNQTVIDSLHSAGKRVLCYFSAGSYENWRPDKDEFKDSDLGKDLHGWEGERWLNTNSENVRKIMQERLDLAVQKKCDGVEPDNVDAYDNDNGLNLGEPDAIDYVTFLANQAHSRNLSLALKNAGSIVSRVINIVEYSVQEQCIEFDNCEQFVPFIKANKPVFHVEYPKGDKTNDNNLIATDKKTNICGNAAAAGFSTIIKNMDLDSFIQPCPSNTTNPGN